MSYMVATLAERPTLEGESRRLYEEGWPNYLQATEASRRGWHNVYSTFAHHQVLLCEGERLVAVGYLVPLTWDGTMAGLPAGWDAALAQSVRGYGREEPTALVALAAFVDRTAQGRGASLELLRRMAAHTAALGLESLFVPVRPTLKHLYPLTPMERYIAWQTEEGMPFDPWLRTHWRLGGEVLAIAPRSKVATGSVAEWEAWTGMRFPDSGPYIVPTALAPVEIDHERDEGRYTEPNVWVLHRTGRA